MAAKPFALGYIGVGLMGGPMSERLVKLGWRVTAYDIAESRLAAARAAGAAIASSAAEAAHGADVVLLNLPMNAGATRRACCARPAAAGSTRRFQAARPPRAGERSP